MNTVQANTEGVVDADLGSTLHSSFIHSALELGIIEPRSLLAADADGGSEAGRPIEADGFRPSSFGLELRQILGKLTKVDSKEGRAHSIVIGGASLEVDSSPIASGLAGVCAGSGYRVLLVDCNLGRPTLHSKFHVSNEKGLSSLLASSDAPHDFPQPTSIPRLAVVPAGPRISGYGSLIHRERVLHRLQPIASHFDYIILDGATLNAATLARVSLDADNLLLGVKEHVALLANLVSLTKALRTEGAPEPYVVFVR